MQLITWCQEVFIAPLASASFRLHLPRAGAAGACCRAWIAFILFIRIMTFRDRGHATWASLELYYVIKCDLEWTLVPPFDS